LSQTVTTTKLFHRNPKFYIRCGGRTLRENSFLAITPQPFVRFVRNFVQIRKIRPQWRWRTDLYRNVMDADATIYC